MRPCVCEAGALKSPVMAGMNWLDYALLIIIGLSTVYGLSHGAVRMLTSFFAFILAIYGASKWHSQAAALLEYHLRTSPAISDILGYAAIFVLLFVAVELAGQRITALAALANLNLVDRLAGAVCGVVLGAVLAGLNVVLLTAILPANYPLLQNSELAPQILSYDQELVGYVPPGVKQVYEDKREQLARYWKARRSNPANAPKSTR
jgi:membrane protein required for colicin V production